jgi:thiol-disulfide isomerase/thioredoxin
MKKLLDLLLTGAATVALSGSAAAGPDLLAEPMVDLAGEPASLDDFRGDVLVVNFWASWCAPCRDELPVLDAWHRGWDGTGAQVVAVSIDSQARNAARFVRDQGLELPVLVDGPDGLAAQLDLPAVPSTYLLDRQGQVVMSIHGSSDADLTRLKRATEDLLAPVVGRTER